MLEQILAAGVFHADPHPGNLHITPDGRLALLDFGIYGELDPKTRRFAALSFLMQAHGEFEMAAAYLLRVAEPGEDADLETYRHAVVEMYRAWSSSTLAEYGFGQLVYDVVTEAARHEVSYPPGVLLYAKAMLTLEGVALAVAPETNMQREAAPFLERLADRLLNKRHVLDAVEDSWPLWMDLAERLPTSGAIWLERQMREPQPRRVRVERQPPRDWLPAVPMAGGIALMVAGVGPAWHGISGLGLAVLTLGWFWGQRGGK
jgi:predicted unusual protein kinase regulating ubiquinone biosynthesis (AarF/ABC1/UbiB family)